MRLLHEFISLALKKQLVREAKVSASKDYLAKERVREKLQSLIADHVASGEIADQADLEQFIKDVNVSMTALKMVPFEVWQKLSGVSLKKRATK
jgi:hypothetical protein